MTVRNVDSASHKTNMKQLFDRHSLKTQIVIEPWEPSCVRPFERRGWSGTDRELRGCGEGWASHFSVHARKESALIIELHNPLVEGGDDQSTRATTRRDIPLFCARLRAVAWLSDSHSVAGRSARSVVRGCYISDT